MRTKKKSVEELVRESAVNPIDTRLNLVQFKHKKMLAERHKEICQKALDFADEHPDMPFYAVLSSAIGSGAWKTDIFLKGYKKFDAERAEQMYKMALAYNEKMGLNCKPSSVVWRLVRRYYEKVSTNYEDFLVALANAKQSDGDAGHFKEQCKNLGIEGVGDYAKKNFGIKK